MTLSSRQRSREDSEQETPSKKARFDSDAQVIQATGDPRTTKAPTAEGVPACDKASTTGDSPSETSEVQAGEPSSPGSTNNGKVRGWIYRILQRNSYWMKLKLPKQHCGASVDSQYSDEEDAVLDTSVATKVTSMGASHKVKLDPRRKTLMKLATPEELLELDTEEGVNRIAQKYLAIERKLSAAASKKRKMDNDADDSSSRELGRATKKQRAANGPAAQTLPRGKENHKKNQPPLSKAAKKAQTLRSSSTTSTASTTSPDPSSSASKLQADQAEKKAPAPEVTRNKFYDVDNSDPRYRGVTSTEQQFKPAPSVPAPAAVQVSGSLTKKQPYPPAKKKLDFYTKRVPLTAEELEEAELKRAGERLTEYSREPTAYSRRQAAERGKQVTEALVPKSKRKQPLSSASGSSNQKPLLLAKSERKVRQKSSMPETDDESIGNRPITSPARPALARNESAGSSGSQTSSTGAFKKPDSRLEALRRKYRALMSDDNLPSQRSS